MKFLRYNLWKTKRGLTAGANFRRQLWKKLDSELTARNQTLPWYRAHLIRLASAGTAGVVAAASFGTGAYAYVSPTVTEESLLYSVKQKIEAVEERILNRTPAAKAKFYLKQIARREAESVVLAARGVAAEDLEDRVEKAEEKLVAIQAQLVSSVNVRETVLRQKMEKRFLLRRKRLERQTTKLEERLSQNSNDKSVLGSSAAILMASSAPKRGELRRQEARAKVLIRLEHVRVQLNALPAAAPSSSAIFSTTTSPAAFPPGVQGIQKRLENLKEKINKRDRIDKRIDQMEDQLDKRLEKLDELEKSPNLEIPLRRTVP